METLGWTLARLPRPSVAALAGLLGCLLYRGFPERRRIVRANLFHAFPGRDPEWREQVARLACGRTIEMGLFILAFPYLSEKRLRQSFRLAGDFAETLHEAGSEPGGLLHLTPHSTLMEALTALPLFEPTFARTGVVYRPLRNPHIDRYVKGARERHGMELLSRREGFVAILRRLKQGRWASILFDQNAGRLGVPTLFFDRLAMSTGLPEVLGRKFRCPALVTWAERTGFWQATYRTERIPYEPDRPGDLSARLQLWLQDHLDSEDPDRVADWLWLHDRWKLLRFADMRFRLPDGREPLEAWRYLRGRSELPRRNPMWIWLPADRDSASIARPYLERLRRSRPETAFTLVGTPEVLNRLRGEGLEAERWVERKPKSRPRDFRVWRKCFIETALILDERSGSPAEAEARATGVREQLLIGGTPRPRTPFRHVLEAGDPHEAYHNRLRRYFARFGLPEAEENGIAPMTRGSSAISSAESGLTRTASEDSSARPHS